MWNFESLRLMGRFAGVLLMTQAAQTCTPPLGSFVFVADRRDVCILPRANNNGRVMGHDAGWSLDAGDYVYHLFGDTYVDRDRP